MLKVSDNFKKGIKAVNRELTGYVKVDYDSKNWEYYNRPTIDNSYEEAMFNDFCVCHNIGRAINYASLERDFFKLDGNFVLPSNPNINKYKYLKITKDRSFTIPINYSGFDSGNIGIGVSFDCIIDDYNTSLIKINGVDGGKVNVYVDENGYILVDGKWNGNTIEDEISDYTRQLEIEKEYSLFFQLTAPSKENSIVYFSLAILGNDYNVGPVISFTGEIEKVKSVEFSQSIDVVENISSIKIPKMTNASGYFGSDLLFKYIVLGFLGELKYYYEFTNNQLSVKDFIENHVATISQTPEFIEKKYRNKNAGFISNTLNSSTIIIDCYNRDFSKTNDLTLYFFRGYPLDFKIKLTYKIVGEDNTNTIEKNVSNNQSKTVHVCFDELDNKNINISQIYITVSNWSNSNYRVRLEKIDIGYTEIYEEDLISIKVLEEISKFNESSPDYSCEVSVNNYDHKFDFLNADGVFKKLNSHSHAEPYIGLKNNTLEYIPLGNFRFSDLSNSSDLTATLKFSGAKQSSQATTHFYASAPSTLSDVISENTLLSDETVLESHDSTLTYDFSTTKNYDKSTTEVEQVRELAFASCSLCLQSRYSPVTLIHGILLYLKSVPTTISDTITLNDQTEIPTITLKEQINQIKSTTTSVSTLSSDYQEVYNQTIQKTDENTYEYTTGSYHKIYAFSFKFETSSPIDNSSVQIYINNTQVTSSTVEFTSSLSGNYYIHNVTITSTGEDSSGNFDESNLKSEITVKILAKTYSSQDTTITIKKDNETNSQNVTGMEFTNNYLRTVENQQHVAQYIFDNDYPYHAVLQTIGDPSLLPGDLIDFETPFGYKRMMIEKQTITYDGGLSATLEGDAYDIEDV